MLPERDDRRRYCPSRTIDAVTARAGRSTPLLPERDDRRRYCPSETIDPVTTRTCARAAGTTPHGARFLRRSRDDARAAARVYAAVGSAGLDGVRAGEATARSAQPR